MRILVLFIFLHIVESSTFNEGNFNLTWSSLISTTNSLVRSIIKPSLPTVMRVISVANISSSCERGLMSYMMALQHSKTWAIEMLDATGKVPSGVLSGSFMDFGQFDECLKIKVPETPTNSTREKFRGRYCSVSFTSDLFLSSVRRYYDPNYTDSYGEPPELVQRILQKSKKMATEFQFIIGICIPSLCSETDLQRISSAMLNPVGVKPTVVDCQVDEPYFWPAYSVAAIVLLVMLALICVTGTALDVIERKRESDCNGKEASIEHESKFLTLLKAFSVVTNSEKVMHPTKEDALSVFYGIRFLSATWIIFGHNYIYIDVWRMYSQRNILRLFDFSNDVSTAAIHSFTLAVDTFFFISGFLLVYVTWRQIKKNNGKLNVLKFFLGKYLRMTPAVCLAMALFMVMPVIDSGPLWPSSLKPPVENCQVRWWANMLYVSNFLNPKLMCLGHMWYVAALMQYHIIGVVILMVFYRSRAFGAILGLLVSGFCTVIVIFQVLWRNYKMPLLDTEMDLDLAYEYGEKLYTKPHFHFTCYLIGMIVAYFLVKCKENKLSPMHQCLGWCCAVAVALFSFYGILIKDNSKEFVTFFYVVNRPAWAMSVGWLVYMCTSGYGGIVNRLLSQKIFYPLSQLSYMMYVLHPLIITYRGARQRERSYFGHSEQTFIYFALIFASILLAFIGSITVEIPFQNIHKIIFKNEVIVPRSENTEKAEKKITEENHVNTNNINNV